MGKYVEENVPDAADVATSSRMFYVRACAVHPALLARRVPAVYIPSAVFEKHINVMPPHSLGAICHALQQQPPAGDSLQCLQPAAPGGRSPSAPAG
jgi:hypothetical protein